jgi:monoamine oxidase
MPPERAARVQAAAYTALFDGARESSNAALSVPTKSVADFLLAPGSPLFEGLESEEERDHAVQLVQSMDGWTGAPLNEVSFRYWGFEREFEGPDKVVADGYVHMLEPLRSQLLEHHGELRLGDAVTALALDEDAGLVRARTAAGAAFTAKSAVCTLPLGVLQHEPATLAFDPPLAPRRRDALKRATFGLLNKVVLSYPHAWWPKDVLDTSFLHVFLPPASADSEPVATEPNAPRVPEGTAAALPRGLATRMLFAQAYAPLNGAPILMVYFGGARGAALERLSDAEARDWVHAALARALLRLPGAPERAPAPAAVHVSRWLADPFARGAYAYVAATSEKDAGADHPSPLHMVTLSRPAWGGRLGFAGEHTEMDHYASVHGALLSGRREAARVKATLEGEWAEVRNDV